MSNFEEKKKVLRAHHEALLTQKNEPMECGNGIYDK
jgi:4-O-beta-D-mannosyl-D-glucose phosphorylase